MAERDRRVLIDAYGVTDVGRVRAGNQDTFAVADLARAASPVGWVRGPVEGRGVLLAVSDGMGGAQGGEIASAAVAESLVRDLATSNGEDPSDALRRAVTVANRAVFDLATSSGRQGMGATLVAALVSGPFACIASVGDSRAYLVRGGAIRQVTRDQSYVELLVSAGVMSRDEAEASPYRHVITQAMGVQRDVAMELGQMPIHHGDALLLCSDGLSNEVTAEEMLRALVAEHSLEAACRRLVGAANANGGRDNITVVAARFDGDGLFGARSGDEAADTLRF